MINPLLLGGGLLAIVALQPSTALAVGGAESMDRPSARLPPLPDYAPSKSPETFTLPPIPEAVPGENNQRGKTLFIQRIVLQGNTVLPEQDLRSLVQPYEGRAATVADLEELRQKLTRYYIDHGYVNSGVVIPADAFKEGELRFVVVEGHLDEIRVKGQERLREGYIKNRLLADPEKPFNLQELQERFQLLLSDPLISRMNGRILPGAAPGHGILDVDVVRALPFQLSLFGNNQRPPSIGAEAFGVGGWIRNLTGLGDSLDFTFTTSDGSTRYAGGYNLPVTDWGTTAFFHFDEGDSMVLEQPIQKIDIKSQVHSLEGGFSHPLVNTLHHRLNLGTLLAVRENETSLLGQPFSFIPGEPTGRNQATVWRIFQDYLQRSERQAFAFRSTFSVGLNALGSTPSRQGNFPSSEFLAWLGQGQYARQLFDDGSQFVLRGNAQFSDKPLLPLERIAVGGMYTVRGYRENQLVRDQGYTVSTEFHYPILGGTDANAKYRLTLIPFMDYGKAWNHGNGEKSVGLYSVGAGVDFQIKPMHAEFYYGYPLNKPKPKQSGDLQDDGLHFQVRLDVF